MDPDRRTDHWGGHRALPWRAAGGPDRRHRHHCGRDHGGDALTLINLGEVPGYRGFTRSSGTKPKEGAMNRAGRQNNQRGTSTLEFAVVLPTLLFVFFSIMELSRAWLTVNIVTTASREGARLGSVSPTLGGNVFDPAPAEAR